ncbi:hypothetical protein EDB85DRAFT_787401 [Lactarius pseudohatsudake]|nr:hypothetical protein EDB85DRAFT_787401 [Lactarius pseudohatsudake]
MFQKPGRVDRDASVATDAMGSRMIYAVDCSIALNVHDNGWYGTKSAAEPYCIDTAPPLPHRHSQPPKLGLTWLVYKWLDCTLQSLPNGHNPEQDVHACGSAQSLAQERAGVSRTDYRCWRALCGRTHGWNGTHIHGRRQAGNPGAWNDTSADCARHGRCLFERRGCSQRAA